ncbi:hypothetical protein [Dactylosporangium sp. CA-139066]|uniref:phage tail tube protein n=1 Tax=Dactylosporangium sp. CA-139066 TaxID=3239930 RepID=UPI003D8EFB13
MTAITQFDPDAIRVANNGIIVVAATGTTIPALTHSQHALTAWADPFVSLGTFNEDGVEHEFSEDTEDIKTWQLGLVRTIVKGRSATLKIGAVESSKATLERFYGAEFVVTGASGSEIAKLTVTNTAPRPAELYVFEWLDSATGAVWRCVFERGQVGKVESPKFNAKGALEWGMTLSALGGSANSTLMYWETNDPAIAVAGS